MLEACGWSDLAPALVGKPGGADALAQQDAQKQEQAEETLLERLVALNAELAAEEARGVVRWSRPEFQDPKGAMIKRTLLPDDGPAGPAVKRPWPKSLAEQFRALRDVLAEQRAPAAPAAVARQFKSAQTRRVTELLATLESLGQAREAGKGGIRRRGWLRRPYGAEEWGASGLSSSGWRPRLLDAPPLRG